MTRSITIHVRYNGPPNSGHGGYSAGLIAGVLGGSDVEVTLRKPPPLSVPFDIEDTEGGIRVTDNGNLIAEARRFEPAVEAPAAVSFEDAEAASSRYPGLEHHPFPTCFACGPQRMDGMRLFAGPIEGRNLAAAPWVPTDSLAGEDGTVASEFIWAALDCPGGWGANDFSSGRNAVLGRIAVHISGPVHPGRRYVVVGWPIGIDGRKMQAGSAIFDEDNSLRAVALATWLLFNE